MAHQHNTSAEVSQRHVAYMQQCNALGTLQSPSGSASMTGACGGSIGVHLDVDGGMLRQVLVQPKGCMFTKVCAGAVSALATGKTLDDALRIGPEDVARELDGLPEDHMHCARLAVNTLGEAIADDYSGNGRAT